MQDPRRSPTTAAKATLRLLVVQYLVLERDTRRLFRSVPGPFSSQNLVVILRKVPKPQLIATFVGIVATGILIVGFVFNHAL